MPMFLALPNIFPTSPLWGQKEILGQEIFGARVSRGAQVLWEDTAGLYESAPA